MDEEGIKVWMRDAMLEYMGTGNSLFHETNIIISSVKS